MKNPSELKIDLVPLLGEAGAWNAGKPIRGARTILVDGTPWGHVRMVGHGTHGVTFEFYDCDGSGIISRYKSTKTSEWVYNRFDRLEKVHGKNEGRKARFDADPRDNATRIIDKARTLIEEGRLVDPAYRAWAAEIAETAYRVEHEARREKKFEIREALRSLDRREDLSNLERTGLRAAFQEIFGSAIDAGGVVV